mmetsp:Transcript_42645/g.74134  ORF Transcript_42645/g.74134 Transcript_42645/m.74134 type:complete len:606 (-) Transcript_42645:246-2063(-)
MPLTMHRVALVLVCCACMSLGRRVHASTQRLQRSAVAERKKPLKWLDSEFRRPEMALFSLLLAFNHAVPLRIPAQGGSRSLPSAAPQHAVSGPRSRPRMPAMSAALAERDVESSGEQISAGRPTESKKSQSTSEPFSVADLLSGKSFKVSKEEISSTLQKMKLPELKELTKKMGHKPKSLRKAELIEVCSTELQAKMELADSQQNLGSDEAAPKEEAQADMPERDEEKQPTTEGTQQDLSKKVEDKKPESRGATTGDISFSGTSVAEEQSTARGTAQYDINHPLVIPSGLLAVYKPKTWTSQDIVGKIRGMLVSQIKKRTGIRMKSTNLKVGHGGTLDPNATGVLVLGIGQGTKLMTKFLEGSKSYRSRARLGTETDTQDVWGKVVDTVDASGVTYEALQEALPQFRGDIMQLPPMYSALQINGTRLYDLARKGVEVDREARPITIYNLELVPPEPGSQLPDFSLDLTCSGGTYVRTIISDLGRAVKSCAHMTELERTRQGNFSVEDCMREEDFDELEKVVQAIHRCNEQVGVPSTLSPAFHQFSTPEDSNGGNHRGKQRGLRRNFGQKRNFDRERRRAPERRAGYGSEPPKPRGGAPVGGSYFR